MSDRIVFQGGVSSIVLVALMALGVAAGYAALVALSPDSPIVSFLALAVIVLAWFSLLLAACPQLVVGKDGVLVARRIGHDEFIAYRDLLGVDRYSGSGRKRAENNRRDYAGITLHLRTKRFVNVPLNMDLQIEQPDRVTRPYELIRERLAAWSALPPTRDAAPLQRDGRTMNAWTAALRELGGPAAVTYRVATIDDDTLLAIAEDPTKQASLRAAAAFALRAKLDERARSRLRVSVDAIADPKLRAVIEHVVNDKPEAEIEALLQKTDPVQQV